MQKVIHRAVTRGHANHGWLDTHHSFSFAGWYNPDRMNFGLLRVLNDDRVAAGRGFGRHPHDNMEIVSIPLSGSLEHQDNMGNQAVIRAGDVQIMSAGTGVQHAEYNHSRDEEVRFLQIWVFPKARNIEPRYEQKTFPLEERKNQLQMVVSPAHDEAVWINQDAYFSLGSYEAGKEAGYTIQHPGNGLYLFVLEGEVEVGGEKLARRDAMGLWDLEKVDIKASKDSEFLLIEVPMDLSLVA